MTKFGKWNALFLIIGVVVVMLSLSGCMAPTPPLAPILSVVGEGNNSVTISWSENSNVEGFYIYESTDGISFNEITSTGAQTNSYTITGLNQNTTYYFEVQAYNANGEAMSNIVKAVTLYAVFGQVTYNGSGLAGVTISFSDGLPSVTTNSQGYWSQGGLTGSVTVTPSLSGYTFTPSSITVTGPSSNVNFFASAPNTIYVTNVKDNTVSVINGQTNTVVATIPVGSGPVTIGVNPTTKMIYVVNNGDNTVSVINGQTNNVTAIISVGNEPGGIGVNPTTDMIYVANVKDNTVSVINGQTNNVVSTIPVGNEPYAIGVNPTTDMIYVVNVADNTVSVINGQTNNVVATIPAGNQPFEIGINPTTNMIYVDNPYNNTISVINGQTNSVVSTITVGGPIGIGINPTTNMIYVANVADNTVSVINGQTNNVVATIPVGNQPLAVGVLY